MNKKFILLFFLLILMVSIAFAYIYINQNETDERHYESSDNVSDEDVANEIDDMFIDEDDEVEIGDIV